MGLTAATSTFTRTSPFAGWGTGMSSSLRVLIAAAGSPPSPYAFRRQAFIEEPGVADRLIATALVQALAHSRTRLTATFI